MNPLKDFNQKRNKIQQSLGDDVYQQILFVVIFLSGVAIRFSYWGRWGESDEMVSVINYSVHLNNLFVYDYPNNHLLNSVLIYLGKNWFGFSNVSVRIFPFIAGTGLIVFGYYWSKRKFGNIVGLIVASCISFSSHLIYYSTISRGYIYMPLFFVLSLFLLDLGIEKPQRRSLYWFGSAVCCALGIWAQPYSVFLVLVTVCYATLKLEFKHVFPIVIYNGVLPVVLAGLLYLPAVFVTGVWLSEFPFWDGKRMSTFGPERLPEIPTKDFYSRVVSYHFEHPQSFEIGLGHVVSNPRRLCYDGTSEKWHMLSREIPRRWFEASPLFYYFFVPWESVHICGYQSRAYKSLVPTRSITPTHALIYNLHATPPEFKEIFKETPWPNLVGIFLGFLGICCFLKERPYPRFFYFVVPIIIIIVTAFFINNNPPPRCYILFLPLIYIFSALGIVRFCGFLFRYFNGITEPAKNIGYQILMCGLVFSCVFLTSLNVSDRVVYWNKVSPVINYNDKRIISFPQWHTGTLLRSFHYSQGEFYRFVVFILPPNGKTSAVLEAAIDHYGLDSNVENESVVIYDNISNFSEQNITINDKKAGSSFVKSTLPPTVGLASVNIRRPPLNRVDQIGYILSNIQFDTETRKLVWNTQFFQLEQKDMLGKISSRLFDKKYSNQHSSIFDFDFSTPLPRLGLLVPFSDNNAASSRLGDFLNFQPFWDENGWVPLAEMSIEPGKWLLFVSHNPNPAGSGEYRVRQLGILQIDGIEKLTKELNYTFELMEQTDSSTSPSLETGRLYPSPQKYSFEYRNGRVHVVPALSSISIFAKKLPVSH